MCFIKVCSADRACASACATYTCAQVAGRTLQVLEKTVPSDVPGIVFLSGGQVSVCVKYATAEAVALGREITCRMLAISQ